MIHVEEDNDFTLDDLVELGRVYLKPGYLYDRAANMTENSVGYADRDIVVPLVLAFEIFRPLAVAYVVSYLMHH